MLEDGTVVTLVRASCDHFIARLIVVLYAVFTKKSRVGVSIDVTEIGAPPILLRVIHAMDVLCLGLDSCNNRYHLPTLSDRIVFSAASSYSHNAHPNSAPK